MSTALAALPALPLAVAAHEGLGLEVARGYATHAGRPVALGGVASAAPRWRRT